MEYGERKTLTQVKNINCGGNLNYIVIACKEDKDTIADLLEADVGIYDTDFIMSSVLRCEMNFDRRRFLE